MTINQRSHSRYRTTTKFCLAVLLVLIFSSYASKQQNFVSYPSVVYSVYVLSASAYVVINLSGTYKNLTFTRDTVYFLNGTAYDFYSLDELVNRTGPSPQWEIFPLPNEQLPGPNETTTGLAFVDHIYITSTPKLIDRHANLERAFARYQLKNYEWRMKWVQDTCYAPENREEVHRKINLRTNSISKNHLFVPTSSFNCECLQLMASKADNVPLPWSTSTYGTRSWLVTLPYL